MAGQRNLKNEDLSYWVKEIEERGIIRGLRSYRGGRLQKLFEELESLEALFPKKLNLVEYGEAHQASLKLELAFERFTASPWVLEFFEKFWKETLAEGEYSGEVHRVAPRAYWFQLFNRRIENSTPPVEPLRPREGLKVYRLQQFPTDLVFGVGRI